MFDPAAKPPPLTAEMLAEKQRLTEERRQQVRIFINVHTETETVYMYKMDDSEILSIR